MNQDLKYTEVQKFNQPWITVMLYTVLTAVVFVTAMILRKQFSIFAFIPIVIVAGVFILFKRMQLTFSIDDQKITFRFKPFHRRDQVINKHDIKEASVIRYNPIAEYGGWGIRYNFKRAKAFTTSGNFGLQLRLLNGRSILIGTQEPESLKDWLEKFDYPSLK